MNCRSDWNRLSTSAVVLQEESGLQEIVSLVGIDALSEKDRLKLEVKIIKKKGPVGIGEAIATVDGKTAVKGELTFAIV